MKEQHKMDQYNFHKTKYGTELLIDLIRIESIEKYISNGDPHVLSYYDITLITEGTGKFFLDEHQFEIKPGDIFFTSPMQLRKWDFERIPKGLILIFEEDFLNSFFKDTEFIQKLSFFDSYATKPALSLSKEDHTYFESILNNIEKEIITQDIKDNHILRALLYQVLVWLERKYRKKHIIPKKRLSSHITQFRKLVKEQFSEQHSVAFYADKLNITPGYLNETAKENLGTSAKQYIQNRIILEAKRLLCYSTLTINEISWQLNFQDSSYFTRTFKKNTGHTPAQYRKIVKP